MKNAFYFILKDLFVLKIFKFLSLHFGHIMDPWSYRKNGLIRNIRLILKFMTSHPGWQTITIHILPNISRSKGNQTMKIGHILVFHHILCMIFQETFVAYSIKWPNFHCLIVFTLWDVVQYVYCNCLLTMLRRHEFWNLPYLSNQAVFLLDQKIKKIK